MIMTIMGSIVAGSFLASWGWLCYGGGFKRGTITIFSLIYGSPGYFWRRVWHRQPHDVASNVFDEVANNFGWKQVLTMAGILTMVAWLSHKIYTRKKPFKKGPTGETLIVNGSPVEIDGEELVQWESKQLSSYTDVLICSLGVSAALIGQSEAIVSMVQRFRGWLGWADASVRTGSVFSSKMGTGESASALASVLDEIEVPDLGICSKRGCSEMTHSSKYCYSHSAFKDKEVEESRSFKMDLHRRPRSDGKNGVSFRSSGYLYPSDSTSSSSSSSAVSSPSSSSVEPGSAGSLVETKGPPPGLAAPKTEAAKGPVKSDGSTAKVDFESFGSYLASWKHSQHVDANLPPIVNWIDNRLRGFPTLCTRCESRFGDYWSFNDHFIGKHTKKSDHDDDTRYDISNSLKGLDKIQVCMLELVLCCNFGIPVNSTYVYQLWCKENRKHNDAQKWDGVTRPKYAKKSHELAVKVDYWAPKIGVVAVAAAILIVLYNLHKRGYLYRRKVRESAESATKLVAPAVVAVSRPIDVAETKVLETPAPDDNRRATADDTINQKIPKRDTAADRAAKDIDLSKGPKQSRRDRDISDAKKPDFGLGSKAAKGLGYMGRNESVDPEVQGTLPCLWKLYNGRCKDAHCRFDHDPKISIGDVDLYKLVRSMEWATCQNGRNCKDRSCPFSHQLKVNPGLHKSRKEAKDSKVSKKICRLWSTKGSCSYGDKCRFSHETFKPKDENLSLQEMQLQVATNNPTVPYALMGKVYESIFPITRDANGADIFQHATLCTDGLYTITHKEKGGEDYYVNFSVAETKAPVHDEITGEQIYEPWEGMDVDKATVKNVKVLWNTGVKDGTCGAGSVWKFPVPNSMRNFPRLVYTSKAWDQLPREYFIPVLFPKHGVSAGLLSSQSTGNASSERGNCGAPWVSLPSGKVIGFHIAGDTNKKVNFCVRKNVSGPAMA
jgi:hypothetical protein